MRKTYIALIVLVMFMFTGCDKGFVSTPIGTILKNPRNHEGKIVKIKGDVVQSVNLLLVKYFVIKDNTGEIYVVTDRILPKNGESITVKGHVQEGFPIGPNLSVVIVEENGANENN